MAKNVKHCNARDILDNPNFDFIEGITKIIIIIIKISIIFQTKFYQIPCIFLILRE